MMLAADAFHLHQRVQRNQCTVACTHEDLAEILGTAAELCLRLQVHAEVAAEQREVVDVEAAERGLHRVEDISERDVERAGFFTINVEAVLRRAGGQRGLHAGEFRAHRRSGNELVGLRHQFVDTSATAVLDIPFDATGHAHADDRRWVEREHQAFLDVGAHAHETEGEVLCLEVGTLALFPVIEDHERYAAARRAGLRENVETGEGQCGIHGFVLVESFGHLVRHFRGVTQRRGGWHHDGHEQVSLILTRHKRGGYTRE
jgi:hypothetical protein